MAGSEEKVPYAQPAPAIDYDAAGAAQLELGGFAVKRACRIEGTGNAALLEELALRIAGELAAGAEPGDMRVVCASPQAAQAFHAVLGRVLEERGVDAASAGAVEIACAREVALGVLQDPEAQAFTGRRFASGRARVLLPWEFDVVVEDLKTWGSQPKRLRKMLDFMRRGFTELADEDPHWLFTVEEIEVRKLLVDDLRYLGAVIEPEISNLACKALRGVPGLRGRFERRSVYVAGYQNLSRASQLMCHLLARESLVVAVNPAACVEVYESYPYAAGYDEFLQINPAATCVRAGEGRACAPTLRVREQAWGTPEDEFAGIAELVRTMVGEGVEPGAIAVACLDPAWYSRVAQELARRGVDVCGLYQPPVLRGDFANVRSSLALRLATALRIVADPRDGAAWRCWMGFDDELAHSGEFAKLRESGLAAGGGAWLADDLDGWDGYGASVRFFDTCRGKTGFELLAYLTWALTGDESARVPAPLGALRRLGEGATAAQMVDWIDRTQTAPRYEPGQGVTVCSLPMLEGQAFDCVILAGFVNGALPARAYFDYTASTVDQRKKMEQADAAKIAHVRAAATQELVASHFVRLPLPEAQRLRLKVDRVMFDEEAGGQVARVSPSTLLPLLRR